MARILVTGAAGFIGRALCPALAAQDHQVIAGLRHSKADDPLPICGIEPRVLGDIVPGKDWSRSFDGAEIIVHLAQRAHRRAAARVLAGQPEAAMALAYAGAQAGVRRLVYVSSIKAMGEATLEGRPFCAGDPARPEDAYGRVKLATEQALLQVAGETGLELVVLRPSLVYGPGVAGNFRSLLRLAGSRLPLPFAAVGNHRSLIFVENLVDLIGAALLHRAAAGRILLAADGDELSTPALIRLLAAGQGRAANLFPLPDRGFAMLRALPGVGRAFSRLTLSLQVDTTATRELLGWRPPVGAEEALLATARAFAAPQSGGTGR